MILHDTWMILDDICMILLLFHPLITSYLKLKLFIMTFSMPSLALILRKFMVRMESLLLFLKIVLSSSLPAWSISFVCVSLLLPILLAGSLLTFKIQPVFKQGDRANPSNYCRIALISYLSKAYESVLGKNIMGHLSAQNLLSDC